MLEEKDKRIAELEQELAELKEKAIVPKFKVGQMVYYIYYDEIRCFLIDEISIKEDSIEYLQDNMTVYDGLFATEQEALNKLKEMNGNG